MIAEENEKFEFGVSREVHEIIIEALDVAYQNARENHHPDVGSNAATFGYEVYHFAVFEISKRAEDHPELLRITVQSPSFRFEAGNYQMACHRVASSAESDIEESFPRSKRAVRSMVQTPYLPGLEPTLTNSTKLVLAHMGNPEDGLCAAYLCVPVGLSEDGRISEWGDTQCIYKTEPLAIVPSSGENYPEEVLPEGTVTIKRSEERKNS